MAAGAAIGKLWAPVTSPSIIGDLSSSFVQRFCDLSSIEITLVFLWVL